MTPLNLLSVIKVLCLTTYVCMPAKHFLRPAMMECLDHLPLYRQLEIHVRQGVDLERSTMAGWVGAISDLVKPLVGEIGRYLVAST